MRDIKIEDDDPFIAIYQDSISQEGEEGGNKVLNEVMAIYRRALKQKKFHYNLKSKYCKKIFRDKDYVNAARHLNRALKDDKQGEIDHVEVYDLLGRAYMRMKRYKKAIKALKLGISSLQRGVRGKSRFPFPRRNQRTKYCADVM